MAPAVACPSSKHRNNTATRFILRDLAVVLRYTRVREWMAEDALAQGARSRARRQAIAALKQEAHRCVPKGKFPWKCVLRNNSRRRQLVSRLHIRQIEAGKALDTDGALGLVLFNNQFNCVFETEFPFSRHALMLEGRVRARLLLHAGLRIEATRIVMEMEEDIAEEMLQAEVRALSEKQMLAPPVNLDEELMRLLKGPGYSLARRSLGIESASQPDVSKHAACAAGTDTRGLHLTGCSNPAPSRISRVSAAILSLHASLKMLSAAADASSSDTVSLACSSSWTMSSVSDGDVAAHDWVLDDKVTENVFRLRETLSSRMYFRTHRKGDFPASIEDSGLKGAFGVVAELGNMIAGVEPGLDEKDSGLKVSIEKSGKGGFTPNEIAGNIGGVFAGAFEKLSSGVEAGARVSRCIFARFLLNPPFPLVDALCST